MQDSNDSPPPNPLAKSTEPLWLRLIYMLIIAAMISIAQTILFLIAAIQFIVILIDNRQPNVRLADFGATVGTWVAAAARYQSVATDTKPWPFGPMD
ncbi:MAG: DUF4389 domain-containing protein [Rhodobacteraceae bacterium]|nr:MAG: DUF4389 domain-containing protein [Paracoccaceae bacterium]